MLSKRLRDAANALASSSGKLWERLRNLVEWKKQSPDSCVAGRFSQSQMCFSLVDRYWSPSRSANLISLLHAMSSVPQHFR
jgi:hypothetical protein